MPVQTRRVGPKALAVLAVLTAILQTVRADEIRGALIATEASAFKDGVVTRVAGALGRDGHSVRVVALEQLANEPIEHYATILLVNSCRAWRPRKEVRDFVRHVSADVRKKLVVVTTTASGKCDLDAPGADIVSTASKRTRIEELSQAILDRLRARLMAP